MNRRKGKPPYLVLALTIALVGLCFTTPAQADRGGEHRGRGNDRAQRDHRGRGNDRDYREHRGNDRKTVVIHRSQPTRHHAAHRPVVVNRRPVVVNRRPVVIHRPAPRVVHHTCRHYPSRSRSGFFLSLPIGSTRITIGGGTYYRHGSTYYRRTYHDNRWCYAVATPPVIVSQPTVYATHTTTAVIQYGPAVGTVVDYIPPDHDTIVVNGTNYIVYNNTYHLPIIVDGFQKYIVVANPLR